MRLVVTPSASQKSVSIRIDSELLEKLKVLADKNHRSLNGEIIHTLERSVAARRIEETSKFDPERIKKAAAYLAGETEELD